MVECNIAWLKELPYYCVSKQEMENDIYKPALKKEDFVNNDFLNDLKNLYNNDVYNNLNFHYFTPDTFNIKMNSYWLKSDFSLFHLNIRSLNKNGDELCQFLNTINCDFDVLVLSEIWSCNVTHFSNLISGYNFYYDIPDSGNVGGVGIYVRSTLLHNIVDVYKISSSNECRVENLWMEVTKGCSKYIIGGIYRHPGHRITTFMQKFDNVLSQIGHYKLPCLIAGDINIDLKKFQTHTDTKAYLDTLLVNNFVPVVVMPTRISDTSATLIDHVYYYDPIRTTRNSVITGGNFWCDLTDHLPNFVFLQNYSGTEYQSDDLPYVRLHSVKNIEKFKTAINNVSWNKLSQYKNVNEAYSSFHKIITDCYNKCFPTVKLSRKHAKDKIWVTQGIKQSSNHKNKLYKKWLCSHNPADKEKYRGYLKVFKKVTLAAQTAYYKEKFDRRINSIKQLWTNLNKISSLCRKKTATKIDKLIHNNEEITEPHDISNRLNTYFCSIGPTLVQSLHPCAQSDFMKYCPLPCKDSMFCDPVTPDEILRIIYSFPNNKAPGSDNISSKILKEISDSIVLPLTYLFNFSFNSGNVPDLLKIAKVVPIYKKGEKHSPGNYRPISLLSIFDKILEKLMYRRLLNFLEKNKSLYEYQFGFRKNYSTSQAVMEVLDNIYQYCDNHEITMGIYLDLQKAFDTVNHTILLQKLAIYGIRGTVLQWFDSYLTNRKQYTVLGDNKSELDTVSCGVPQGSVLGPLLFLIYVNDIQYAISTAKIKLFADDTNLFLHNCNPAQLFAEANICMAQLLEWFTVNRLSLNLDKTCYSIFGPRQKDANGLNLYINGKAIQNVKCCKYLGILIDSDLKWQDHINYVYNKLIKFTSIFYKIRNKLPQEVLKMIYFAFIHSHLLYGIEVYANTTPNHLSKLTVLNNKLLRILQYKPIRTHSYELYQTYFTLPVQLLHKYQILIFMHNYMYYRTKLPVVFSAYFEENKLIHQHNTRHKDDFHINVVASEFGKRAITYKGSTLWNNLPSYIKDTLSSRSFKLALKNYLLQSLVQNC